MSVPYRTEKIPEVTAPGKWSSLLPILRETSARGECLVLDLTQQEFKSVRATLYGSRGLREGEKVHFQGNYTKGGEVRVWLTLNGSKP